MLSSFSRSRIPPSKLSSLQGQELAKPDELTVSINHASQECLTRVFLPYLVSWTFEINSRK